MNIIAQKILLTVAILLSPAVSFCPWRANALPDASTPLLTQSVGSPNQNLRSFFETGRPRSEDTLRFQRPPGDIPPVRTDSGNWQFIVFSQGNVSFWMPPGILSQDEVLIATSAGDLNFRTLTATDGDYRYVAAHARGLTPQHLADRQGLFNALRARVAPQETFSLLSERPVALGKETGTEFTFASDQESIVFRAYLVGEQIYVIGVGQPRAKPRERVARTFLNALQWL